MKRLVAGAAFALAGLFSSSAFAQDDLPYVIGGGALYEFPDSHRDSDDGFGGQLSFQIPLASQTNGGIEFDLYGLQRDRKIGGSDKQVGLFASYVHHFGLFGWEQSEGVESYLPSFVPYVLGGVGLVYDDVLNKDHYAPALTTGAGIGFPLSKSGLSLRTEVRLIGSFPEDAVANKSFLLDTQLRVGLWYPLGRGAASEEPQTAPPLETDCGLAVVDPVTGRKDCSVDSDRDGVPDTLDLCPGTPEGTPVDANGCPAAPAEVVDSDGDGVADDSDACPTTPAGATVDEKGCVVGGKVVLDNVRFAKASAELTPEAKKLLDQAAVGLNGQRDLVVEVAGHTDGTGRSDYNLMLSLLRAENVRKYLVDKGVSRYRLFVEGYGVTRPVASNDTEEGRAKNRRVDLDELDVKVIEKQ